MEIPSNEFRKIGQQKVASKPSAKKGGSTPPVSSQSGKQSPATERINVSAKAKDIQRAQEVVKSAPDIRVEKVEKIKKAIAEGRFKVDSDKLAGKILEDIIKESAFLE